MANGLIEFSEALAQLVETVGKSVVRVQSVRRHTVSGVVWNENTVVSVAHGLHTEEVSITTDDGKTLTGRVRGLDQATDLAVIEVAHGLPVPTFAKANVPKVGQLTLRLGRPGETVRATSGILSAVGQRPFRVRGAEISRYVESDAAHQPGFSGGPLVNTSGEILGINTRGLMHGRSVAIPYDTLKSVVEQLLAHGKRRKSYLGLTMQPVALPDDVRSLTNEELGLFVLAVESDGPAAKSGIAYGDTVLHLGDDSVKTLDDVYSYLGGDRSGQAIPVKLFRQGKVQTIEVTLGAR